jgi:hypothetical protein
MWFNNNRFEGENLDGVQQEAKVKLTADDSTKDESQ